MSGGSALESNFFMVIFDEIPDSISRTPPLSFAVKLVGVPKEIL